jgi:hypothetical protein
VSGSDQRLVGDIEKLIKTKVNLETVAYEDDRPRSRESFDKPRESSGAPRVRRESNYASAPRVSHDPFFDKPYEAPVLADGAPVVTQEPLRKSPNIKPKRKVAALFKTAD